jgi:hypothetical protein
MQKLSLLVAVSVMGLGSAYSAMAQTPAAKPGAKATIQAPALVAAKSNLGSFARVAPAAEARSAPISVGALAKVASAQAVTSPTGGKLSALAVPRAAATNAKSALISAVSTTARTSSAAASRASLNPAASRASSGVVKAKSDFGSMARVTSASKVSGVSKRANMSALAQAVPAAGMVNKSNFNAYAK